jgi:hypothetical protein
MTRARLTSIAAPEVYAPPVIVRLLKALVPEAFVIAPPVLPRVTVEVPAVKSPPALFQAPPTAIAEAPAVRTPEVRIRSPLTLREKPEVSKLPEVIVTSPDKAPASVTVKLSLNVREAAALFIIKAPIVITVEFVSIASAKLIVAVSAEVLG